MNSLKMWQSAAVVACGMALVVSGADALRLAVRGEPAAYAVVLPEQASESQYFWIGPGRFDKDGKSRINALYVDKIELALAE